MKSFFNESMDAILTITLALLVGLTIGMLIPSKFSISSKVFFHNILRNLNPDSQKDSQTLIMEKVTKDTPNLPQNSIFEEPEKKENGFILYIKKVFFNQKDEDPPKTITDYVLN